MELIQQRSLNELESVTVEEIRKRLHRVHVNRQMNDQESNEVALVQHRRHNSIRNAMD
jgi:hypothetical protein